MTTVALLREVEFLASLDDETLGELVEHSHIVRRPRGARIVSELESGADVFVVLSGTAEVFVEPRRGDKKVLQTLGPGRAFGEMSSLTGGLRSATVEATTDVEVLVIPDATFDALRERRPEIAVALLRTLAKRFAEADRAVDALLSETATAPATIATATPVEDSTAEASPRPAALPNGSAVRSIKRVWHELVVDRNRDLTFLTLASFVLTLVAVRLIVYCSFRIDFAPRGVLRGAYMTGFTLLFASAAAAVLTFSASIRCDASSRSRTASWRSRFLDLQRARRHALRSISFSKDIHTADPDRRVLTSERLYRPYRTSSSRDRDRPRRADPGRVSPPVLPARLVHRQDAGPSPVRAPIACARHLRG